jgi:CBS domain-containing protein
MLRELLRTGPAELNVKEAMAPIVRFARLYALRHGIGATATIERLAGLGEAGVLAPALHDQIVRTWWFLSQLRLQSQEESSRTRGAASDLLDTRGLSAGDEAMLRAAAAQVVLLQKRISFDFLGSAL